MKFGVVQFPGSNCDDDAHYVVAELLAARGSHGRMIWHKDREFGEVDALIIPGGFSYGDYLRGGAMAAHSPIMAAVKRFADAGGPVLGICNGFQILCEAGLLAGALTRNASLQFVCADVYCRIEGMDTPFTHRIPAGRHLRMSIAHAEGCYVHADIQALERAGQVIFRYCTAAGAIAAEANPNGSLGNIAGVCNAAGNVVGLMPHPERAVEDVLGGGGEDGCLLFESALASAAHRSGRELAQSPASGLGQTVAAPVAAPVAATAGSRSGPAAGTGGDAAAAVGAHPGKHPDEHPGTVVAVEPEVTAALAAEHGLSADEYQTLTAALARVPTYTELGIVSVMWSEHCSYKSSRLHLKTLPTTGARVIQGPGENAGVVDIGANQAVVFKMESHNHPSFIEPYQGAATGVGGICRDIFTMGARPIALADSLRFGRPEHARTKYLLGGVVAGIGGYGNSFGVPTVAGDVNFDASYDGNILVNAFCLGVARADRIFRGTASGVGNPILYVGAKTGRDGIHGATMASAEFGEDAQEKRPAVQVGDPFMEKLLLEACLELMESDILIGIQDMGAAGLTSSSVEMASRAGSGVDLDLDRVPQREAAMIPYELMLSESQERMLMVVRKGCEEQALAVFEKWDLDAAVIGTVTDNGRVVVRMHGRVYADLPVPLLAEGLTYDRPTARPQYLDQTEAFDAKTMPAPTDLGQVMLDLLAAPNIASKEWVIRQYDYNVRHGTVVRPGAADAAVVRVPVPAGSGQGVTGVAITSGCCSRHVYLAPYEGTRWVVAEAYANLVAVGAQPLAVTDCLNFGNPEKPEIMWQLAESIRGLGDACRELEVPVVSGNVSLYNETDGKAIKPTPMVAMVGLLENMAAHATMGFQRSGDIVAVVGDLAGTIAGSEYLARVVGTVAGIPARFDSPRHKPVFDAVLAMVQGGHLASAHDISDGGLAVAVAESAIAGPVPLGVAIELAGDDGGEPDVSRLCELLFGEAPARFVVSLAPAERDAVAAIAERYEAPFTVIGEIGGDRIDIRIGAASRVSVPVASAHQAWSSGFATVAE